ncbi:MAG: helix-turn-helix domain-containing protein, partial [Flectobacillus sp.]|nr:helix-turn-helix domain-containing protein [Flectobacillus sp.]
QKGSTYLAQKVEELLFSPLKSMDLACDNKETQKAVAKIWEQALQQSFEKVKLLQCNQTGFDSTSYLTTKANINIDFEAEKGRLLKSKQVNTNENTSDLFQQLRAWRDEIALDKNIEKYMVLSQKSIQALTEELPRTKTALAKISGLGKVKIQQFGDQILDLINDHCERNGIEASTFEKVTPPTKKAAPKGSTQLMSFNLFKEGNSVETIATMRQLSATTIEGHLAEFVKKGMLHIEELMEEDKIKIIRETILENPTFKSKELKELLGDEYSYGEIRLVWGTLNLEG